MPIPPAVVIEPVEVEVESVEAVVTMDPSPRTVNTVAPLPPAFMWMALNDVAAGLVEESCNMSFVNEACVAETWTVSSFSECVMLAPPSDATMPLVSSVIPPIVNTPTPFTVNMDESDAFMSRKLKEELADVAMSIVKRVPVYVDEVAARLSAVELSVTMVVTPSLSQASP
jgi:hypothetical protein